MQKRICPPMVTEIYEAYMVYHHNGLSDGINGRRHWCDTANHNGMTKKKNIISITDIIELKEKRELELQEYETQLSDLHQKKLGLKKSLGWVEKEIQMASFIITTIRKEITTDELVKEITREL